MAQILNFPNAQKIELGREKKLVQEAIAGLSTEADSIAERVRELEDEAISAASRYYEISTEVLFLYGRLQALQTDAAIQPYPFPLIQMELPL